MNVIETIDIETMAGLIDAGQALPLLRAGTVPEPVTYRGEFWEVPADATTYRMVTAADRKATLDEQNLRVATMIGLRAKSARRARAGGAQ
jgi:hypothetical protein